MKKIIGFFIVVAVILYVAYEALMYYDNNFRYGRMRETPAVRPQEVPLLIWKQESCRSTPAKPSTAQLPVSI